MFTEIDLEAATGTDWDVVIVGSSFSAMFFLLGLPPNLDVLIVEKGGIVPWDLQVQDRERPKEDIRVENSSDAEKTFVAHTLFGGNSNCWWGQTPRFHPNDFRLNSLYGVGHDWPVGYDELEPYYTTVENVMQIAGAGTGHIFPRSQPYPYPAHALSRTDAALTGLDPDRWVPVATARSNGGDRASCCGNGICDYCPIDAKFTVMNSVHRFTRPRVRLLTGAECRAVETSAGRANGIVLRTAGGERRLRAGSVALAANAFFNAAILLRSSLGGPATGRYLHEHAALTLEMDIDHPNWFGGSSITLHGYGLYDGEHRRDRAAVLIENFNAPAKLRFETARWTERLSLKLVAEDLPQAGNRVVLDAAGEPFAEWLGHSHYALRGLEWAERRLPDLLPFRIENVVERKFPTTEAHIQGTHRMGTDPAESVTDPFLRLHGVDNLYVLGAGAFPSCTPANPTLTLSALALRAAESLS